MNVLQIGVQKTGRNMMDLMHEISICRAVGMHLTWLKDISTPQFSTPSFNPGLFNPRHFNHMAQKIMVEKFMIKKSGVEESGFEKTGVGKFLLTSGLESSG